METKENSLVGNLREFTALQAQYAKVRALQPIKAVQEIASKKINDLKTELSNQAKYYNQNKKITNDALVEYANELNHISNEFNAGIASLEEKRQNIEKLELQAITRMAELKQEIKEGQKTEQYKSWKKAYDAYAKTAEIKGKSGNVNEMLKSRQELRRMEKENPLYAKLLEQEKGKEYLNKCKELLAENDKKQASLKQEQLTAMDASLETRNKSLAKITKQNIFQRTIGFIMNKVNGSKKFENNVMKPLRENLKNLKEKRIPQMSKKIGEIAGKVAENINIKEVLIKGKETKDKVINGLADRLKQSNDKTRENIKNLSSDKEK